MRDTLVLLRCEVYKQKYQKTIFGTFNISIYLSIYRDFFVDANNTAQMGLGVKHVRPGKLLGGSKVFLA